MKALIKNWLSRTFMTILLIASVVAIVKTSVLHETLKNIAACACLMVSWLCARVVWPRKVAAEPALTIIPMPSVPESVASLWPDGDVVERILQEEQREMQRLPGEQQHEGDEG